MHKSLFIVIDGMDGTGKTEMVKRLHNYLYSRSKRCRILTTREPTSGIHGEEIRHILETESDPLQGAERLLGLFIKDRQEHLTNVILPFLGSRKGSDCSIVICDRYYYSTIAFQNAQGIALKRLLDLNSAFMKPDIALILDSPPELCLKRIDSRKKEKFEQLEFMNRLRENFLHLQDVLKDNIKIIDASGTMAEEFELIRKEIENLRVI